MLNLLVIQFCLRQSHLHLLKTPVMYLILPAQVNPSPSNGEVQVQLKAPLRGPSLVQTALESQGLDRQGSGTEKDEIKY